MESRFTVQGRRIEATTEQVEAALRDVEAERIHVHSVEVNGRDYPVRQAMEVAFDLDRQECFPQVGCRVFRQLGFRLHASSRRPRPKGTRARLRKAIPNRNPEIGPVEDVVIELPRIHLAWFRWERWEDIAEHGVAIAKIPRGESGVYEARLSNRDERLTIGRASDLRTRVVHGLVRGTMKHTAGDKIRAEEDLSQVVVRWARTDRPAAIEEELHLRHIAEFGRLPKHIVRT